MTISERLKFLRKQRKITQEELAKNINVERSSVGKYETGTTPSMEILMRIAKYFNVTIDYLLGNETQIKNNDAISDIVIKLSQNEKFLNTVNLLYNASDEQLTAVESMLLAFK